MTVKSAKLHSINIYVSYTALQFHLKHIRHTKSVTLDLILSNKCPTQKGEESQVDIQLLSKLCTAIMYVWN